MLKRLMCRLGRHQWRTFTNDDDASEYRRCVRCGQDESGRLDITPDGTGGGAGNYLGGGG